MLLNLINIKNASTTVCMTTTDCTLTCLAELSLITRVTHAREIIHTINARGVVQARVIRAFVYVCEYTCFLYSLISKRYKRLTRKYVEQSLQTGDNSCKYKIGEYLLSRFKGILNLWLRIKLYKNK